jgi:hypothetical protein
MKDITKLDTMIELQGDAVLVDDGNETIVLTIVHFVDPPDRRLILVYKEPKVREEWPFTQEMANMLVPFKDPKEPRIKWRLKL